MPEEQKLRLEAAITEVAQRLAEKLNREIERGNDFIAFTVAVILAGLKDGLEIILALTGIGLIPVLGQIPGLFLTVFLTAFLWGKGWFLKTRIKIIWWILGVFIDNLPGVNALPMATLSVLYAWRIVKKRAKSAEEKLEKIKELTEKEIENLDKDISLLDVE